MKIRVTLKDPDGFDEGVVNAVREHLLANGVHRATDDQKQEVEDDINDFLQKWVTFREYVTLEFDTDTGTATVMESEE